MRKQTINIENHQDYFSQKIFWKKLFKVALKLKEEIMQNALFLYYVLVDPNTPTTYKVIIIGTLGYFIYPFDLIRDFIPITVFSDDLAILTALVIMVQDYITHGVRQKVERGV